MQTSQIVQGFIVESPPTLFGSPTASLTLRFILEKCQSPSSNLPPLLAHPYVRHQPITLGVKTHIDIQVIPPMPT
jgi:hypothetical protein